MKIPPNIRLYGDPTWRGKCATETAEQITLIGAVRRQWPDSLGKLILHIKNEGKRSYNQNAWDSANGMVKGASDVSIAGAPSFVCELKRQDHTQSRISGEQVEYLEIAQDNGAWCCIALGWEAAFQAVKDWHNGL